MDQIRHKCGYYGWLFRFNTNFVDHSCFKHYIEEVDHINVDENYVVTIIKKNPIVVNRKQKLDEILIEAVRSKSALYDFRVFASERTVLRKNALWMEVSNILQGSFNPEEAKARWKYLRDNYIKARKKLQVYVPSGSAATNISDNKSRFQYYELMKFLNDSLQTRQIVSSLTDASVPKSEIITSLDIGNKQHKDHVAGSSMMHQISRTPTPTKDSPSTSTESRVSTRTRATKSKQKKSDAAFQTALMEALREPATQTIDPLDGFLVRLGEGMRKLPYRDRARLEIQFLTLLAETENLCFNRDSDRST